MSYQFYEAERYSCAYPIIKETVPKSALGYNANNQYPEFPPLMSDGRSIVSSYQPESTLNNDIIQRNQLQSNWEYRNYLVANSVSIMEQNFRAACNDTGYSVTQYVVPNSNEVVKDANSTPYYYRYSTLTDAPFGYASSDLKDLYYSREQLDQQKQSGPMTQYDMLQQQQ